MYSNDDINIKDIAGGSREAFKALFYRYYTPLFRYASGILKSNIMSEEVVSEVFFIIWKNRELLPEIQNIKAYLYAAVRNKSISCLRQAATRHTGSLTPSTIIILAHEHTPEQAMLQDELNDILHMAIESLPSQCKNIFKLTRVEGLPYKQVAELLGISVRTIDGQLAIAQKKLHRKLLPYINEQL